jgi:hypothetical protein
MFSITITYPLHVSATMGHPQVEYIYWSIPKELFLLQWIRCFCLDYQLHIRIYIYIYILTSCFDDFLGCLYGCGGNDSLLLLLHFSILLH